MKILLDTCAFVWLCAEPARLSSPAKKALQSRKNALFLSEVSIMEICFKVTAGKLTLPTPPSLWVEEQIDFWRLEIVPITRSIMYRAGELPLHHRDPFDRLLIASALERRARIVTPDREFGKYPVSVCW